MTLSTAKLADIAEVASGGGAPQNSDAFSTHGCPFVRAGSLNQLINGVPENSLEHLTEEVAKEHGLRKFPPNTVVFAKSGMSATKGYIYRLRSDAYVVNHLAALIPTERVDPRFLEHALRVFSPTRLIQDAAYPSIRLSDLSAMQVPFPPLAEQRRIAAVLDKADELGAKRRTALAQLEVLTQSIFLGLFNAPAAKDWPVFSIADISDPSNGSIRTGPFGSQLLHSEFVEAGVAVLGIDNAVANEFRWHQLRFITERKYRELKRYTVKPGDVLITIMGTCGRCAVVPDNIPLAISTKHMCCITLNREKCNPVFLHAYFLRHPDARRYLNQAAKGAIMSGLNMAIIKAMPVLLPPLEMQGEFVRRVAAVEDLKTAYRASLTKMDALFTSLQHRAFRGEAVI